MGSPLVHPTNIGRAAYCYSYIFAINEQKAEPSTTTGAFPLPPLSADEPPYDNANTSPVLFGPFPNLVAHNPLSPFAGVVQQAFSGLPSCLSRTHSGGQAGVSTMGSTLMQVSSPGKNMSSGSPGQMDMKTMAQGLSLEDVEDLATRLETGKNDLDSPENPRCFLLALLGPHLGVGDNLCKKQFSGELRDSDIHAITSLGSDKETILPSYSIPRSSSFGLSSRLRHSVIELPLLVDYYIHSSPGLHNLPSNIPTFLLVRKYWKKSSTQEEMWNLNSILKYRLVQDVKAEEILTFLSIPRDISITEFRAEHHRCEGRVPYLRAVLAAHVFDKSPEVDPPCRSYLKPMEYLATKAFSHGTDVEWWKKSLKQCHDYFESLENILECNTQSLNLDLSHDDMGSRK